MAEASGEHFEGASEGIDEEAILREQLASRQAKGEGERLVVLRVYNYFRIVLSFLLLIVFYEIPDQEK